MQKNYMVKELNASAMQCGVTLGLFGVLSLAVFKWSFTVPFFSTLFFVMLLAGPVLAAWQTMRFRNAVAGPSGGFTFLSGFLHSLFTGFYASVWVALVTFVYLQYFDNGAIFADYARSIDTPEMKQYLQQSGMNSEIMRMTGGEGVQGLADALRSIGAATYAAMSLYCALVFGPFIAVVIGLVCRRGGTDIAANE